MMGIPMRKMQARVNQNSAGAAVLPGHIGEPPNVAEPTAEPAAARDEHPAAAPCRAEKYHRLRGPWHLPFAAEASREQRERLCGVSHPLKGRPQRFTLGRRILRPTSGKKKNPWGQHHCARTRRASEVRLPSRRSASRRGIALEGWKNPPRGAGPAGRVVRCPASKRRGLLLGARINPSTSTCTHEIARPDRQRKLLSPKGTRPHPRRGRAKGYTCVATSPTGRGPSAGGRNRPGQG